MKRPEGMLAPVSQHSMSCILEPERRKLVDSLEKDSLLQLHFFFFLSDIDERKEKGIILTEHLLCTHTIFFSLHLILITT